MYDQLPDILQLQDIDNEISRFEDEKAKLVAEMPIKKWEMEKSLAEREKTVAEKESLFQVSRMEIFE